MNANEVAAATSRWGKGIKLVAVGSFALLFHAWLKGEIGSGFLFAAILTAVYWTVGSFLEASAPLGEIHRHNLR